MPTTNSATDPVCGMTVQLASAAGSSNYNGASYSFCSTACKTRFDAAPAQYASGAARDTGGHDGAVSE